MTDKVAKNNSSRIIKAANKPLETTCGLYCITLLNQEEKLSTILNYNDGSKRNSTSRQGNSLPNDLITIQANLIN